MVFALRRFSGGIKDIAGTMVAVMVFLIAIRSLISDKGKMTFEEKIVTALIACDDDIKTLVNLLNSMFQAYLASVNIKVA